MWRKGETECEEERRARRGGRGRREGEGDGEGDLDGGNGRMGLEEKGGKAEKGERRREGGRGGQGGGGEAGRTGRPSGFDLDAKNRILLSSPRRRERSMGPFPFGPFSYHRGCGVWRIDPPVWRVQVRGKKLRAFTFLGG